MTGYYTLTGHRILQRQPATDAGGMPALLLRRLSVVHLDQGKGVGSALLADALRRVLAAAQVDGSVYVVAEAHGEPGHHFLRHHGFRPLAGTDRLTQRIVDVSAALGATPWTEVPPPLPRLRDRCVRTANGLVLR